MVGESGGVVRVGQFERIIVELSGFVGGFVREKERVGCSIIRSE